MNKLQQLRFTSILGAFLVGFWLPIRMIGYIPPVSIEIFFDLLISAISAINIYLHFQSHKTNPKIINSWLKPGIIFDLICLLPLSLFAFVFLDQTFEALLFLNLLSVRHVRRIKEFLDQFDSLEPMTYRLIPLVVTLPLLVHLVACGWISLGSGNVGPDSDKVFEYVKAIYWTFTTLTTVGYGDISAKTIAQMLYTCGIQVLGVGVFGYILSNVASVLARRDAAREHHMDNLDKIETFMKLHDIPNDLKMKTRGYYHYLWANKKGYQDQSLLENLPAKIQSELFLSINKSIIDKVPFLQGAKKEMIEDLMNELKPRIFVPGEKIFRVNEVGDALYFVQNGQVDILTEKDIKITTLEDGAFFGEMALLSEKPRNASAIAASYCDTYCLTKESFDKVMITYPQFKQHLEDIMNERTRN